MTNHSDYIRTVTVSPDGRYLVSCSDANYVIITEIATNTKITEINVGSDAIGGTFSPDGGTYFVGNRRNSNLRTYELKLGVLQELSADLVVATIIVEYIQFL